MLKELTAQIVAAYSTNNPVSDIELPKLIHDVYYALAKPTNGTALEQPASKQSRPLKVGIKYMNAEQLRDYQNRKRQERLERAREVAKAFSEPPSEASPELGSS